MFQNSAARLSLIRKLLSALASAAGENFSAVSRSHSFTEAMFHFAVTFFRLVGSFHRNVSSVPVENKSASRHYILILHALSMFL